MEHQVFNEYDVVKSTKNLTEKVLFGCRGTIVLIHNKPHLAYEVEFFDDENNTIELLTVQPEDIELIQYIDNMY